MSASPRAGDIVTFSDGHTEIILSAPPPEESGNVFLRSGSYYLDTGAPDDDAWPPTDAEQPERHAIRVDRPLLLTLAVWER